VEIGLYGKLPSHGDFLRRRVSDAFVVRWDTWLQESIAASRRMLGERWLEIYLTSPAWRFVCSPGAVSPLGVAGILIPSVDRVGRYFPLTIVWDLPAGSNPLSVAVRAQRWFEETEAHVVQTLNQQDIDLEQFDATLTALGEHLAPVFAPSPVSLDAGAALSVSSGERGSWRLPLGHPKNLDHLFQEMLQQHLSAALEPVSLWWTEGSVLVEPSCLMGSGLPDAQAFAALLDGAWSESGWHSVPGAALESEQYAEALTEGDEAAWQYRSAGLSDAGNVRPGNQDAFLDRMDIGLWAVADGMGGHERGDLASRMVCDALTSLAPADTLANMIEAVRSCLQQVNQHLRDVNPGATGIAQSGSTVVVLLARRSRLAVLWAGDSRAYRLRENRLECLTEDHAVCDDEPSRADSSPPSLAITRAVGCAQLLELDLHRDSVRQGDRFLLCSDGLTREVSDARIEAQMQEGDTLSCATALIQAALASGAHDNVTVLVIDAL
jgi:type VI secretion system protein ImpM